MPTTNHWQNNHRTAKVRHRLCSGNTADMWGLESDTKAEIHAARKSYEGENSECLLLVDADNAFNKLNRKVSLENTKRLCPPMYTYLRQQLQHTRHALSGKWEAHTVTGGCDARDNAARPCMYALSTRPLVQALSNETANGEVKQVWYADDSSAVGSLAGVKKWREYLQVKGPDFGYCLKPVKTILLIKQSSLMQSTQKLFKDDRIKITDQGERHLAWISNWDGIIHGTIP